MASCGFSYRRSPAVAAVADLIRDGWLSAPHFNGRYWCDYAADPDAPGSWRYAGPPGSGALADLGSHLIDLAEQLCGPVTTVQGRRCPS